MNSNSSSFSTSKYPDPRERSGEFRTLAVTGSIVCASFLAGGAYLGYIFNLRRIELLDDKWSSGRTKQDTISPSQNSTMKPSSSWRTFLPGPGATRTPAALALKAFGYGTLLSLATFGVATWSITAYLHSFGPKPPIDSYYLTEKDVKGLSREDREAVVDFGLWMDAREVDENLRLERETTSTSTHLSIISIKDARAAALSAALAKAAANSETSSPVSKTKTSSH